MHSKVSFTKKIENKKTTMTGLPPAAFGSIAATSTSSGGDTTYPHSFYQNSSFNKCVPATMFYSALAHFLLLLAKPFPFLLRDVKRVAKLHPQNRFRVPSLPMNDHDHGHVAIVTGSNTGIGFETATSLVEQGYDVILACRSKEKGELAANQINQQMQEKRKNDNLRGKAIFLHPLDLSSLKSVKDFTSAFTTKYKFLNILVNNAGINSSGKSVDGMDLCFQTNFVGHYLLTRTLLPQLLKAENKFVNDESGSPSTSEAGRVVNLSSVTHHFANCNEVRHGVPENKTQKHDRTWWKNSALPGVSDNTYKESKLAALVFTHELNKRYSASGLRAISANPGSVNSDIWRNYPKFMQKVHSAIYLSSNQGAQTSIAASVGKFPSKDVVYLQPYYQPFRSKLFAKVNDVRFNSSFPRWFSVPTPIAEMLGIFCGFACTDPRLPADIDGSASALWDACEELVGLDKDKNE